jgi:ferredoxin
MDALKKRISELIESGTVDGFLGLKNSGTEPFPYLFTKNNLALISDLTTGTVRYPLSKILLSIVAEYPDKTFGIMCRACDERALIELYKNTQLQAEKVITLGIACTDELAQACTCSNPVPSNLVGEAIASKPFNRDDVEAIISKQHEQRFSYWTEQFGKCLKCYGCRNICPVCFCQVCTLEDQGLVPRGKIPPEVPSFHLSRAYHMAGRCVDCGLCEEACPVDIPLRTLYRRVREIVDDLFDYLPGEKKDTIPPIQVLGDGTYEIS